MLQKNYGQRLISKAAQIISSSVNFLSGVTMQGVRLLLWDGHSVILHPPPLGEKKRKKKTRADSLIRQHHYIAAFQAWISNSHPKSSSQALLCWCRAVLPLCHLFSISSPASAKDQGTNRASASVCFICHYLMVMTPKRNSYRNTPLILWVVLSLCTIHSHPQAREIKGICWIEVSLGKICRGGELFNVNKSRIKLYNLLEQCRYRFPGNSRTFCHYYLSLLDIYKFSNEQCLTCRAKIIFNDISYSWKRIDPLNIIL